MPQAGRKGFDAGVRALAMLAAFALVWLVQSSGPYDIVRERAFDTLLDWSGRASTAGHVVVVDIDRETLLADPRALGRERMADLIERIAEAKPRAIGLDILIEGPDERSPAALARRLAEETKDARILDMARALPDADARFAQALRKAPVVLGAALSPEGGTGQGGPRAAPIFAQGAPRIAEAWQAPSAIGPPPEAEAAARGVGALVLPGDQDARVRRIPLLVVADGRPLPGLAAETVRAASGAAAFFLSDRPLALRIGAATIRMQSDAMLRLRPGDVGPWTARSMSAASVLASEEARARLSGRIVLVGSSAPELGGLRPSARVPLAPSVQLQADAIEQILSADVLRRPDAVLGLEAVAATLLGALGLVIGLGRSPGRGAVLALGIALAWGLGAVLMLRLGRIMVDPVGGPALLVGAFGGGALVSATRTLRREARLRQRFEQHLAPEIVRRIVERPDLLKLDGEIREITALFTDVEGFTSMTERAEPRALVAALDRYFEGVTQVIVDHGGMVEKIVGDGLHALFNAPIDLADHPARALDCACAIQAFSERYRREPAAMALGFGRTRIGLETGMVVVGDIGGGRKLDYTAHGDAMNTAARLEALNKELGSAICVGPVAAGRIPSGRLRSLGAMPVRGRTGGLEVFEPWPAGMSESERAAYAQAMAIARTDAARALGALRDIAARHGGDIPMARVLERLAASEPQRAI